MRHLLIILLICLGTQEEKYDISLKLEEGKVYYQTIRTESDFLMVMYDQEMPINTTMEARLSFKVLEVHHDQYDLQVQYEKLYIKNKGPMVTMEYSSEYEDSTNIMSGFLKGMVYKPFTASMDKQGKMFDIQNADTLYSGIWDGKASEMIESRQELNEKINEQLGFGMIMDSYNLIASIYPGREIAEGESWNNTSDLGKKLGGSTMNTFSFMGLSNGNAIIEGASETYTKDEGASMKVMGKTMKYDLEGDVVFNALINYHTGWIKEAVIRQDFKGNLSMEAEEAWNNVSVPLAIMNVITISNK